MLAVAEIIEAAGVPAGAVSILPMTRELGDRMVADPRFKLLTFTGSPSVGWRMKDRAGKKKVVLELGGNAGVIVDKTANIEWAVKRCLVGAFTYAGQVCISVQRMFIHEDVWDQFMDAFIGGARGAQGRRPARCHDRPRADGRRHRGRPDPALGGRGGRDGRQAAPRRQGRRRILPADDPHRRPDHRPGLLQRGVRAALSSRSHSAISTLRSPASTTAASGSRPGVFTNDLTGAWKAFAELEVGGVMINDVPTYRIDHMPYGGVKDSGLGREGLRYAMEDMTEIRIMVLAQPM